MSKLTPTSYALLGLLARAPCSAYELNSHLQRSVLRTFWPRVASHIYSEPKKLLEHKLVIGREETRMGRNRTVYAITNKGRKALSAWLELPAESHFTMPFEAMLKFLYAEAGDKEVLLSNLDALEQAVLQEASATLEGVRPFLDGGVFSDGMPYNGMALNLIVDVMEARLEWITNSRKQLSNLQNTGQSKASERLGLEAYRELVERLEAIAGRYPGS